MNPSPETVSFQLKNKLEIQGWYFRSKKKPSRARVLFFHGNGQNRFAHFVALFWLVQQGYDLVIFDYPGYGTSGGKPTPSNTVESAVESIRYVSQLKPSLPLVVYGHSLGGIVAMRAVWELRSEIEPSLLVVDSSFLSYQRIARRVMSQSFWTWCFQPLAYLVLSDRWAMGQRMGDLLGIEKVIIHSRKDEVIPFDFGEAIFNSASSPKEFWVKESGKHHESFSNPEGMLLKERLLEKLNLVLQK